MPAGIESALQTGGAGRISDRRRAAETRLADLSRGAEQRRVAACALRGARATARASAVAAASAAPPPHSISCRRASSSGGAIERHREPPQRLRRRRRTRAVCSRTSCQKRAASPLHRFAADLRAARRARRLRARTGARMSSPSCQALAEIGSGWPAQRFIGSIARACVHLEPQRGFGRRPRQHLERHFERSARACRASRRAGARRRSRRRSSSPGRRTAAPAPRAVDQHHAEHEVAQRAGSSRAAGPDRPAATQPPSVALGRRNAAARTASIWPSARAASLRLRERRAAARRDHQLGRLVGDDAAIAARVEDLAARRVAVEVLACRRRACAARVPRAPRAFADALLQRAMVIEQSKARQLGVRQLAAVHVHARRTRRSARSVGTALPGLSSAARIERALDRDGTLRARARRTARTSG